ncbi:MAG: hypothetical protein ACLGI3_12715 [Actinomycetes bacterium]
MDVAQLVGIAVMGVLVVGTAYGVLQKGRPARPHRGDGGYGGATYGAPRGEDGYGAPSSSGCEAGGGSGGDGGGGGG